MLWDPATIDVRKIRDIQEMRPVDIAASFGFPRITALLDTARPPELLAYVTAGEQELCNLRSFASPPFWIPLGRPSDLLM